jgi:hypothetical protein
MTGLDVQKVLRDEESADEAAVDEDSIDREPLKEVQLNMATASMLPVAWKEDS